MGNYQSAPQESAPRVVIVGGGFSGTTTAKELDGEFHVTLIDQKDHFYFPVGATRGVVEPGFASRILIPYDKLLRNGVVHQGKVTEIRPDEVVIQGQEAQPVKFDYLIISVGAQTSFPRYEPLLSAQETLQYFSEPVEQVAKAEHVLIIGGGPIGVELLGEIKDRYPEKQVTLVQGGPALIGGKTSEAFQQEILRQAEALPNAKIILNDRVSGLEPPRDSRFLSGRRKVQTENGIEIEPDLVVFCSGAKPATGSLGGIIPERLDSRGAIKVNEFLQLEGYENIFVAGDCNNSPDIKQVLAAEFQGSLVAQNIRALVNKSPLQVLQLTNPTIFVPIGKEGGATFVGFFGGFFLGPSMTAMIKGRDLFVSRRWSSLNLPVPAEPAAQQQ